MGVGDEFEVFNAALEEWKIQNEIVAIVIDTTLRLRFDLMTPSHYILQFLVTYQTG